jgi:hypothetical protein
MGTNPPGSCEERAYESVLLLNQVFGVDVDMPTVWECCDGYTTGEFGAGVRVRPGPPDQASLAGGGPGRFARGSWGWITEKLRAWSDCEGAVERVVSLDMLLTNIVIVYYWAPNSIASAAKMYY